MLDDVEFRTIDANGVSLRLAMQGNGPLVILCQMFLGVLLGA